MFLDSCICQYRYHDLRFERITDNALSLVLITNNSSYILQGEKGAEGPPGDSGAPGPMVSIP